MKTTILAILLVSCHTIHSQSGLVAFYRFNGNANDAKNSNHGTVIVPTLTSDRFGIENSAYNFNGVSNYISLPNNTFGFPTFTYSAWVNTNSLLSYAQTILSIGNLGADQVINLVNFPQSQGNQHWTFFPQYIFLTKLCLV